MKVLFVHEGYISEYENAYYSLHYYNSMISRYKAIADEVTFLTRQDSYNKNDKNQNKLDIKGFQFVGISNYKRIKGIMDYHKACRTIEKSVIDTDFLVARLPGDLGNLAIKYANKHNKRYIIELVGCAWDALWNYGFKGKIFAPILYYKTKKHVYNAPYVVYLF
jgi:hypothetical protein